MDINNPANIIDILSKRYIELRTHIEKEWNAQSEFNISTTGWSVIACINDQKVTITSITRSANFANISRQAIHKVIKNLEARGLVLISDSTTNKKVKCIELTSLGKSSFEKLNEIKATD